jgi:hypothetical protein
MDNNLNQCFLTFNIYEGENLFHSIECPRSHISEMTLKLKDLPPKYTVKIVDHEGKLRMDFSMFDKFNIVIPF